MKQEQWSYPTIPGLLQSIADGRPDAVAIESPAGETLTYAQLVEQMQRTRQMLRGLGIGPRDRVATVLPDGPDAAVAFLSIAASAVAAPFNQALRTPRYSFYLGDLPARALIVPSRHEGDASAAAHELGTPVIELHPNGKGLGRFDLVGADPCASAAGNDPLPGDTALILYTSGTTAKPKRVALSHRNLTAAASYTSAALQLGHLDRCLHFVPMFHIQGLLTALLAPLSAGGTAICTSGFQVSDLMTWITRSKPTWFTGVPTMHQAIVERAASEGPLPVRSALRFVRSSAAALPTALAIRLERTFDVPVVNGYGMTEASPIIASSPLPPDHGKAGSVGRAAGPDVAILDEQGAPLGPQAIGEIAVRGPNVIAEYEGDADATASSFVNGWFRTGDQGYRDEDGYLFLTGRLKEIINRGGEKIAPREIEETLLAHPGVAEAVAFGIPDGRLGQIVGAAVVLRRDHQVSERALRDFTADRLAFFKIPARIVSLDELPKGPTGKVIRVGLAGILGLDSSRPSSVTTSAREPQTPLENELVAIWSRVLGLEAVGVTDNFFVLGGDSILVVDLLVEIHGRFAVDVPPQTFFSGPTVRELAEEIAQRRHPVTTTHSHRGRRHDASEAGRSRLVVPLQPTGTGAPLFLVHAGGDGSACLYREFAQCFGARRQVYGVQAEGDWQGPDRPYQPCGSIEALAARYVEAIRTVRPHGPYHLGGASFGGTVAFEMARQLAGRGEQIGGLYLFASHVRNNPNAWDHRPASLDATIKFVLRRLARRWPRVYRAVFAPHELHYQCRLRLGQSIPAHAISARFYRESRLLVSQYQPHAYDGAVTLFRAADDEDPIPLWTGLSLAGLDVHDVPGGHLDMFASPYVEQLAATVARLLDRVEHADEPVAVAG